MDELTMGRIGTAFALVCTLVLGWPHKACATTTDTTARQLLLDGMVTTGAAPGTNGSAWETDELFQGYIGAVNWYVTWDNANLYLGREGGNNAEGTVLYLQADYPGAIHASRGFDYQQLNPEVSPMGGVNFAAFFKNSYDEYRTYDGTWSAASTVLNPAFAVQTTGDNLEVAIPWDSITRGQGRPRTIRFVMYQVTSANLGCGQEFVYGESPWGTGNLNDGPNVAVNDGVPVSLRQPGGCDVGDSTARRWWGCFPVVGNISANSWSFTRHVLALDSTVCVNSPNLPLEATATTAGSWATLSAPVGAGPVAIANGSLSATTVSNLDTEGDYVFLFTGNGTDCFQSYDTVVYHVAAAPVVGNVLIDTTLCPQIQLIGLVSGAADSLVWDLGGGMRFHGDTVTFDYSFFGNGSHPFTFTASNFCGGDSFQGVVEVQCLTRIESRDGALLSVSPNPGGGRFEVRIGGTLEGDVQGAVYDLLGRNVHGFQAVGGGTVVLDLTGLPAGRYLLVVEASPGRATRALEIAR